MAEEYNNLAIVKYRKIGALNILKFALAFITFIFHWRIHFGVAYNHIFLLDKFARAGAFAMSGFFMLSGFLLYYIYSNKDFSDFEYLKKFYLKRSIKILPSYYFFIFIMYIFNLLTTHQSVNWSVILVTIVPIQAFLPDYFGQWLVNGLWFVSVLLFLYFLFPYLCNIVKSVKNNFLFSVFIYILGILPFITDCYHTNLDYYYHPQFRICEFIMGMITAKLFLKHNKECKNGILYILLVLAAIYIGVSLLISNNFFNHHRFNYISIDVILLILFPALMYLLSVSKNKIFIMITNNKVSDFLGNIAFSFFLTQILLSLAIRHFVKAHNYFGMTSLELLILSFILNMLLATVLYEYFEKPVSKKLINKFIKH